MWLQKGSGLKEAWVQTTSPMFPLWGCTLSGEEIFQKYISKVINHLTAVDYANLTYMPFWYYFIDFFLIWVDSVRPLYLSWISKDSKAAETSCWRKESIIKWRQHKRRLRLPVLILLNRDLGMADWGIVGPGAERTENRGPYSLLIWSSQGDQGSRWSCRGMLLCT